MMKAMPLPVSIALAGQRITRFCQNVMATSSTTQVRIDEKICGIESRKSNSICPSTCSVMKTDARCSRGSRQEGRNTGYETPRIRTLGLPAMLGALTGRLYAAYGAATSARPPAGESGRRCTSIADTAERPEVRGSAQECADPRSRSVQEATSVAVGLLCASSAVIVMGPHSAAGQSVAPLR